MEEAEMKERADNVSVAYPSFQTESGGSIPASALMFHVGERNEAESLVLRFHYSHRVPSNVRFVGSLHVRGGLFGDKGEMVAAAFFCIPPTRWSVPVLELSRLVRADGVRVPLTLLIGLSCRRLNREGHSLLVSFADMTQGHEGIVYRAANWNYAGCREKRMDGLVVNGDFVPGRTCNHVWDTRSPTKLKERHPTWDIVPHYDEGKHLYWKALNANGDSVAAELGLKKLSYPKTKGKT